MGERFTLAPRRFHRHGSAIGDASPAPDRDAPRVPSRLPRRVVVFEEGGGRPEARRGAAGAGARTRRARMDE